eukprot:scaffold112784_cov63-Phaeocystis_antarctica.AAC.1
MVPFGVFTGDRHTLHWDWACLHPNEAWRSSKSNERQHTLFSAHALYLHIVSSASSQPVELKFKIVVSSPPTHPHRRRDANPCAAASTSGPTAPRAKPA